MAVGMLPVRRLCRGLRAEYHARGGANVAQVIHRVRLNGYGAADNAYYELCRAKQHVARYAYPARRNGAF